MKHLLTLMDWSGEEITSLLDLSDKLKKEYKRGALHAPLKGKTLGMIFQKASTRTRVSFEAGMFQLGGHALFLSANDLQIGRGEPVQDTARVLSRYLNGIMIRTFAQQEVDDFAKFGSVPIINGLTDLFHPCQVLADLMTVREHLGDLKGRKLCFIGDGNNMANTLIVGGLKMGMQVAVATPKEYQPHEMALNFAKDFGSTFTLTTEPALAAVNADVIATDVWASMGQEKEQQQRQAAFAGYQVNDGILALTNKGCIVQHCLPAHRGEEITAEVFEAHANEIFDEAENRLHAQKAVLVTLMS